MNGTILFQMRDVECPEIKKISFHTRNLIYELEKRTENQNREKKRNRNRNKTLFSSIRLDLIRGNVEIDVLNVFIFMVNVRDRFIGQHKTYFMTINWGQFDF